MAKKLNVAMIGQGFMGRSHSNAWCQVNKFFNTDPSPVMHTVYGQEFEKPEIFAARWGWQNASTDWEATINLNLSTAFYLSQALARHAVANDQAAKIIAGTARSMGLTVEG